MSTRRTTTPARTARKRPRALELYFPETLEQEARAMRNKLPVEEAPSYSAFLLGAVVEHVGCLEEKHNGGRQWPPATAEQMKHSRPGRGRATGVKKTGIPSYPSDEVAGRIRGTAVALNKSLTELVTDAIHVRVHGKLPQQSEDG